MSASKSPDKTGGTLPTTDREDESTSPNSLRITQYQPVEARAKRGSCTATSEKVGWVESRVPLAIASMLNFSWLMRLLSSARE